MQLGFAQVRLNTVLVVNIYSKLVALLLLFGLLASPVAAANLCWNGGTSSLEHCPPRCPMMAKSAAVPNDVIQGAAQTPSCCQLSPARPLPPAGSAVQKGASIIALPNVQTAAVPISSSAAVRKYDEDPPPLVARLQAVLCTFLI
jgi:hypothetical protein